MAELSLLAKATVILALALAATRVARRAPASVRALVLACAFAALVALPLATVVIPPRPIEVTVAPEAAVVLLAPDVSWLPEPPSPALPAATAPRSRRLTLPSFTSVARGAWLLGALAASLPLLVALARLRTLRRRALPWPEGEPLLDAIAPHARVRRRVQLLLHEELPAPMTCGVLRPAVVLPADAPRWREADLRRALLHEVEHVRRLDWPVHVFARLVCAAYWFHPLAWMSWRQLCLEAERACDDAVVRNMESTAYAQQLLSLARRLSTASPAPLLSMVDRSHLAARVRAVLDATQPRGHVGMRYAVVIGLAAAVLTLVISPLQAVSTTTGRVQAAGAPPAFEVASVRRNTSGETRVQVVAPPESGRLTITNMPITEVIQTAYGLQLSAQLSNVPEWARSYRVDIVAKAAAGTPRGTLQAMLKPLLIERFRLAAREERREMDALVLTFAHSNRQLGAGLKKTSSACDAAVGTTNRLALAVPTRDDAAPPCGLRQAGPGRIVAFGLTMSGLAALLAPSQGVPVSDGTGLDGRFDIELTYTPQPFSAAALAQRGATPPPGVDPNGPPLATALRDQLGLALDSRRTAIDVVVIDRIEPPTEDGAAQAAPARFEVASVRRNTSGAMIMTGPLVQPGNRLTAQNTVLRAFITAAYGVRWEQIVNGPPWIDTERFDLDARADERASQQELRAMLRALLEERFGLAMHMETRQAPVYALMRTRTDMRFGAGLRPSGPECAPITAPRSLPPPPPPPAAPGQGAVPLMASGTPARCPRMFMGGFVAARAITMTDLAAALTMPARRPIVDRTGLTGEYDVDLTYAPDFARLGAAPPPDAPSLFTALQEQLGLKLEPEQGQIEVLVIDRVHAPTEN